MLSGALQGAISTNLHNHLGRTGWQWAFIINVGPSAKSCRLYSAGHRDVWP